MYSVCVAVRLIKTCSLVRPTPQILFLFICILPSAFLFNVLNKTDTRCLRAQKRWRAVHTWLRLCSCLRPNALLSVGVWIWGTTERKSNIEWRARSLAAGFLLENCSERLRFLQYFVFVRRIERVLVLEAFGMTNDKEEQTENWLKRLVVHNFTKLTWLSAFHYAFITIFNCVSLQYFILLRAVLLRLFIIEFLHRCFLSSHCFSYCLRAIFLFKLCFCGLQI